ncbi:uncharacterized protein AB9X84_024066 isoform 2-T9 [Acanthopagrus schlegelii]
MVQLRVVVLGLLAAVWCFTGAAEGERITACLNHVVKITCAGHKKININHIGFGVGGKCLKGRTIPSNYRVPCIRSTYQKAVQAHCHNKTTCGFIITQALVNVFSCRKKHVDVRFLYLDLKYTCV